MTNHPKSLYIHIPFCEHICDYCDFTKILYNEKFANQYIKILKEEIESYSPYDLETVYIGGGTPTSLSDSLFFDLLSYLSKYSKNVKEYTIEANPESLSDKKIDILKKFGVNRISIGVESTDDEILKTINRHHTFDDVKKCVKKLKENGITNINLDLIIGLPNCTENMFKKDLENIVCLDPNHISCYSLTVHEHTVFYNKNILEPEANFARHLYDVAHDFLQAKGYIHYEVSNWCKNGCESLHNLTYWRNKTYYGVGLGSSGYISNIRYRNTNNINKYLLKEYIEDKEIVEIKDLRTYMLMTSLRIDEGLDLVLFKNLFNENLLQSKKEVLNKLIINGLLYIKEERVRPTYEGMMLLDQILIELI